jgi:hypothetical protein
LPVVFFIIVKTTFIRKGKGQRAEGKGQRAKMKGRKPSSVKFENWRAIDH